MSPAINMVNSSTRSVPLAVRSGTAQAVEHDVRVADHRHEERVLDADAVGDNSLNDWQNGTADDGHVEKAGVTFRQAAERGDAETEDGREHDRVEQADGENAPHGHWPAGEHRYADQGCRADRAHGKQTAGVDPSQQTCSDE